MNGINRYRLGEIPPQRVWGNEMLKFSIDTSDAASTSLLEAAADPNPAGKITVEQEDQVWNFIYEPDAKDRMPFTVMLTLNDSNTPNRQAFVVEPRPVLPTERQFVDAAPGEPDRSLYVEVRREDLTSAYFFNAEERTDLKKVFISGLDLIFDKRDPQHSFRAYDNAPENIKEMHIHAGRLIIRQKMSLPQTDVFVTARELIMEGDGAIDTTPKNFTIAAEDGNRTDPNKPVPGEDGKDGGKGGDIQLNIGSIQLPPGPTMRFILKGTNGQDAGQGMHGEDHSTEIMQSWSSLTLSFTGSLGQDMGKRTIRTGTPFVFRKVNWQYSAGDLRKNASNLRGEDKWPASGGDALRPGKAGDGGDGGAFTSSVAVPIEMINTSAGLPGQMAKDAKGGGHGQPVPCCHLEVTADETIDEKLITTWKIIDKKITYPPQPIRDGQSYAAEAGLFGTAGEIRVEPHATSDGWQSGIASIPQITLAVKEAFLANNRDLVRDLLETNLPAVSQDILRREQAGEDVPPENYAMQTELAAMHHRLANSLDYFTNPAGWTPLLSLQANLQAYDNEIDRAMKTLFLAYWVENVKDDKEKLRKGLQNSVDKLEEATRAATQDIKNLQSSLPDLQGMIDRLKSQITNQNNHLADLSARLTTKARDNLEERHAVEFGMSMLTAVTSVVAYGQPALSAAGNVTSALVTSRYKTEEETRGQISTALATAGSAALEDKADEIIEAANADPKETDKQKQAKARAGRLKHVAANLGPAVENVTQAFQNLGASQDEIDVELARLEAQNPEFQGATREIAKLNSSKAEFASQLTATTQAITDGYNRVAANALAVASFREQITEIAGILNPSVLRHVAVMKKRSLEVLIRYQYYLVKSYEATWLKPYEKADYQLGTLVEKITALLGSSQDGKLTSAQFESLKVVFTDKLDEMLRDLLENLRPEYTASQWLTLSEEDTPDLIKELNEQGETRINLMNFGMISPDYENVRMADISIEGVRGIEVAQELAGQPGTIHIDFTLSGDGTIRSDGRLYVVRHPTTSGLGSDGESGLRWGIRYNVERDILQPVKPSSKFISLLRYMLKDESRGSDTDSQLQYLSSPAAWTDIVISKSITDTNRPIDVRCLTLKLDLTYSSAPRNQCVLRVTARGSYKPLIDSNSMDLNDRDAAYGSMYRIFRRGARVTLMLPETYGRYHFSHWEVFNAHTLLKENVYLREHTFDMTDDLIVEYVYVDPIASTESSLTAGAEARRSAGGTSNLRAQPSAAAAKLDSIPAGSVFKILEGPLSAENYIWWKVSYNKTTGWVAGGRNQSYWIEPLKTALPPLRVGMRVKRAVGGRSNVRETPSANGRLLGTLSAGAVVTILEGPIKADGYTWWKIESQAAKGWTVEAVKESRYLEPL